MYPALATTFGALSLFLGGALLVLGIACSRRRGWLYDKLLQLHDRTSDETKRARSLLDLASACLMALMLPLSPRDGVRNRWVKGSAHTVMAAIALSSVLAGVVTLAVGAGLLVLAASLI